MNCKFRTENRRETERRRVWEPSYNICLAAIRWIAIRLPAVRAPKEELGQGENANQIRSMDHIDVPARRTW